MNGVPLTRRHFLKVTTAAGGGLLIGFYLPESDAASIQPQPWTALPQGAEINAWLAIDAEGNVTIRVPHTEMGQGALTSVSMMIAEELDVDWTRVRAVFADPNRHLRNNNEYTTMFTAGSALVRRQHPPHHAGRRLRMPQCRLDADAMTDGSTIESHIFPKYLKFQPPFPRIHLF